jgi:hypothetical protein
MLPFTLLSFDFIINTLTNDTVLRFFHENFGALPNDFVCILVVCDSFLKTSFLKEALRIFFLFGAFTLVALTIDIELKHSQLE